MEERIFQILGNINEEILETESGDNLLSSELLDSIDIMELVDKLERAFDIEIQPNELELKNFETKENIVNFVKTKNTKRCNN